MHLVKEMSNLSTLKKKEVTRLSRRLEILSLMKLDDDMLTEMEEIKLALNLEADKEEVE